MKNRIRFAGFTEGVFPYGRKPVFVVETHSGEWVTDIQTLKREGVRVPAEAVNQLADEQHRWNNVVCE